MQITRRRLLHSLALVSSRALFSSGGQALAAETVEGYRPDLLPSRKVVWDWRVWMAKLGPKFTGNKGHTTFVNFLETELKKAGLEVSHDPYTFTRWDAKRYGLSLIDGSGHRQEVPVTSYHPYSGQTPAE
jgi:hypothetical protein